MTKKMTPDVRVIFFIFPPYVDLVQFASDQLSDEKVSDVKDKKSFPTTNYKSCEIRST